MISVVGISNSAIAPCAANGTAFFPTVATSPRRSAPTICRTFVMNFSGAFSCSKRFHPKPPPPWMIWPISPVTSLASASLA